MSEVTCCTDDPDERSVGEMFCEFYANLTKIAGSLLEVCSLDFEPPRLRKFLNWNAGVASAQRSMMH